jgi:uncharacterized GH25 family protein
MNLLPRRSLAMALTILASSAVTVAELAAHDLFFRPDAFRVPPQATVIVPVLNGTFSTSENAVARDRLADISLVGPFGRRSVETAAWSEKDPRSDVRFDTGAPGTYVLGAAIKPKVLELPGKEFNAYLKEEGIDRILASRKEQGRLQEPSKERYAKFPKTLIQVGEARSGDFAAVLGYEAEIVPLDNPYSLKPGATLRVRCLLLGKPLPNYVVRAGGRRAASEKRLDAQRLMTDAEGVVVVKLTAAGDYYVTFVHMREVEGPEANYESRWATLTFAVAAK